MTPEEVARACYANRLRAASRAITRHYDTALKKLDLKVSQLGVLTVIAITGGEGTIIEIADHLGMDRSTLSRNLDPLERRGLVALGVEERHRARRVSLTQAGEALLQAAYPLWSSAQNAIGVLVGDMPQIAEQLENVTAQLSK